jgi:hypothetical protein
MTFPVMKIICTKTRWYFETYAVNGHQISGCVEFAKDAKGVKRVEVYDLRGAELLWSSSGVRRMDAGTARMAFEVYAKQENEKCKKPMRLAFSD